MKAEQRLEDIVSYVDKFVEGQSASVRFQFNIGNLWFSVNENEELELHANAEEVFETMLQKVSEEFQRYVENHKDLKKVIH